MRAGTATVCRSRGNAGAVGSPTGRASRSVRAANGHHAGVRAGAEGRPAQAARRKTPHERRVRSFALAGCGHPDPGRSRLIIQGQARRFVMRNIAPASLPGLVVIALLLAGCGTGSDLGSHAASTPKSGRTVHVVMKSLDFSPTSVDAHVG